MLVESMTTKEIYAELERDRENVTRWVYYQSKKIARQALKCTHFPMSMWMEYTSPRKIRYIIRKVIFTRKAEKSTMLAILVLHQTKYGISVCVSWLSSTPYEDKRPLILYPHMFHRYAERTNSDKQGVELIKQFMERNQTSQGCEDQRIVGRSVRYNGKTHLCYCVNEGIVLGQIEDGAFVGYTFITYDMATGRQKELFEEKKNEIPSLFERHQQLKNRPFRCLK